MEPKDANILLAKATKKLRDGDSEEDRLAAAKEVFGLANDLPKQLDDAGKEKFDNFGKIAGDDIKVAHYLVRDASVPQAQLLCLNTRTPVDCRPAKLQINSLCRLCGRGFKI